MTLIPFLGTHRRRTVDEDGNLGDMAPGERAPDQIAPMRQRTVSNDAEFRAALDGLDENGGGRIALAAGSEFRDAQRIDITAPLDNPHRIFASVDHGPLVSGAWTIGGGAVDIRGLRFRKGLRIAASARNVTIARCHFDHTDETTGRTTIVIEDGASGFVISFNTMERTTTAEKGNAERTDYIAVKHVQGPSSGNYIGHNLLRQTGSSVGVANPKGVAIRIAESHGDHDRSMGLLIERNRIDFNAHRGNEQGIETKLSGTADAPLIVRHNRVEGASIGINIRRQATRIADTGVNCIANLSIDCVNQYADGGPATRSLVDGDIADALRFLSGSSPDYDACKNWVVRNIDPARTKVGFMFARRRVDAPAQRPHGMRADGSIDGVPRPVPALDEALYGFDGSSEGSRSRLIA